MKGKIHDQHKHAEQVLALLEKKYPNYQTLLSYRNAYELLIAVILSAQTTDAQVNKVTPELFKCYPTPETLAKAIQEDVEKLVFETGFYKNKAKNIIACAHQLQTTFNGQVPNNMESLITLSGVGRKSAGVVLFHIYDIPAIIVDTHFGRVCRRLGWTVEADATKVELEIKALLPQALWGLASMVVNYHGRMVCKSRQPDCESCILHHLCPNRGHAKDIK